MFRPRPVSRSAEKAWFPDVTLGGSPLIQTTCVGMVVARATSWVAGIILDIWLSAYRSRRRLDDYVAQHVGILMACRSNGRICVRHRASLTRNSIASSHL
jgi:hypothetical protein